MEIHFFAKNRLSCLDSHIHSNLEYIGSDRFSSRPDGFEYSPIPAIHSDIETNPIFRMNPISNWMDEEISEKRFKTPSLLTSNQNHSQTKFQEEMNKVLPV